MRRLLKSATPANGKSLVTDATSLGTPREPLRFRLNLRLSIVLLLAFSISLPMAWIGLSKLLLFAGCLVMLIANHQNVQAHVERLRSMAFLTPMFAALALFVASLLWTVAPLDVGLTSLVKHSRWMVIALLVLMLRNTDESRWALLAFSLGMALQLVLSWLLAAGATLPWPTEWKPRGVVFTSYLDQSIMLSTCAAVWWHLRPTGGWQQWAALCLVAAALANVLLLLDGRTGYLIAVALITLAAIWQIPLRLRWPALILVPAIVFLALTALSANFLARLSLIGTELKTSISQVDTSTSTGWRINTWQLSVRAIEEAPVAGHGVGSFTTTIKRLQGANAESVFGPGRLSNPHQEFLLWGIELGVVGVALLVAIFIRLWSDFNRTPMPVRRAGLSALAALFIACCFNSTLYDGLIGDFFVTLLGLLLAHGALARQAHNP